MSRSVPPEGVDVEDDEVIVAHMVNVMNLVKQEI